MNKWILALMATLITVGLQAAETPINNSRIAFTLPEKDLLPENIAYDPQSGAFFIGSTRKGKILRYQDGQVSDFVAPRAHGLWMVIGMKVDAQRRVLWAASSSGGNLENYDSKGARPAGLFKFNLDSGELLGRWVLDGNDGTHFFNDLVVAPNGDVYVTHMFDKAAIYRLEAKTSTFAPIYRGDNTFEYPNGITLTADGKTLFVAHRGGVSRLDLDSRQRKKLPAPADAFPGSADGLYLIGNSLIAIFDDEVRRLRLDAKQKEITAAEILEAKHPMFMRPSTGVLVNNELYYIANAQFDSFDENGNLWPMHRLYEPVILKLPL